METVIVKVNNKYDFQKLMKISSDNGWQANSLENILDKFIADAPKKFGGKM
jgi:hypothetical protein